jgi:uncharacterized protein YvpB
MRKITFLNFNKRKAVIVFGIVLAFGILARWVYYMPQLTYLRGKLVARMSHGPKTLGLTLVRLPVVFHRQEHSLSCEIAALKMALDFHGINVKESELIENLHFDLVPRKNGIWGDPYTGFVGDIDGKMGVTGYGVYWQPVSDVANKYTYSEVIENATVQELAQHLSEGRPIVWWGYYGRGRAINWQTVSGKAIIGINGEHARVLTGFVGTRENPTGFYLMDPIYGELFWETEYLLKNSTPFANSGVVVYSPEGLFGGDF